MWGPDEFDEYYKDVRNRLLVLTYCLTGDLPSSRAAVRDGFIVTWHHWRKVSRVEDPEAWTRVRACAQAQRRHTAKLWHREKGLDPEVKATLDALAKLPINQRRMLLLTELTTSSLAEISREVGLPRTEAERDLQKASAQFSVLRDIPTTSIRTVFEPVRAHVEETRWPRATIIRRAGSTRRRTHTIVGIAATVATLVVTGALVTDATGVRPTLSGERVESAHEPAPSKASGSSRAAAAEPVVLPQESMLSADEVARAAPGSTWTVARTDDNSRGDGLALPCQEDRYADPHGAAALVRTFDSGGPRDPATAAQATQTSATARAANRGYDTALGWFAGCADDRAQLMETHAVSGVGDEAVVLVLRTWGDPQSSIVAGVARSGKLITTAVTRTPLGRAPAPGAVGRLLAVAVGHLCELPEAGTCVTRPDLRDIPPVPVASVPAMLAEVDLPPVTGVVKPWVGTEPRQAKVNAASTNCDRADFSSGSVTNNVTRTFLIPGAKLPAQFGITETIGSLPEKKARAFVARVRDRLAGCSKKQMGTDVVRVSHLESKQRDLSVWRVTIEISDKDSVTFLMGIVRDGTSIAQVGFVPGPKVDMARGAFIALVQRALDRLDAMPRPKTG